MSFVSHVAAQAVMVQFQLDADAEPGLLSRLLLAFAKRDLIPDRLCAARHADRLRVDIAFTAADAASVALIEGNLRQIIGVRGLSRCIGPDGVPGA